MARRGAPALYELMRQPGGSAPAARPAAVGSARHGQAPGIPDSFTISFARLVAVAVGVVVAIAIAYGIGVQRGRSSVAAAAPSQGTAKADSGGPSGGPAPKIPALGGKSGSAPSAPPKAPATDNNGDPRVKGMRYFVLGHPASERAAEMVEFCRLNGLDAYLVPDNTALLRKVIVLPGYADAKDKASPEIKALEAKIRSVGEKWKKTAPRINKDFSEAFPEKFQ